MCAFEHAPAVVPAAGSGRLVVHFLVRVLTDIADQHGARPAERDLVEAELPRIAETKCPDLWQRRNRHAIHKRVVTRHDVPFGVIVVDEHIDAEEFAKQRVRALRGVERIVAVAAVAERHVQQAVRAEGKVPTVVVRERLLDEPLVAAPPQIEPRCRIGDEPLPIDRLKRATTVFPFVSVKLRKNRRETA